RRTSSLLLDEEGRPFFSDVALHLQPLHVPPQPRQLLALLGRQRAGASPAGIDLSLPHPRAQRRLGEIELPGDRPEALLAPLHQPDRLRLELRRERSPLPPSLLSHDTLLSHFRASWGVHETGASSECAHHAEGRSENRPSRSCSSQHESRVSCDGESVWSASSR